MDNEAKIVFSFTDAFLLNGKNIRLSTVRRAMWFVSKTEELVCAIKIPGILREHAKMQFLLTLKVKFSRATKQ